MTLRFQFKQLELKDNSFQQVLELEAFYQVVKCSLIHSLNYSCSIYWADSVGWV